MASNAKADLPATIYHYCGPISFRAVLKSKQLWLSDVHCMNDSTEQTWLINMAARLLCDPRHQGDEKKYLQAIVANFDWMALDPHALCFSENPDLLSQWRAYAEDGTGYSIGYSSSWIESQKDTYPRHYVALWAVEYDTSRQCELLNHYIDNYLTRMKDGGNQREEGMKLILAIYGLSGACKNPHFGEEKEIRLLVMEPTNSNVFHENYTQGISERFYRKKDDRRISCFSLAFPEDAVTSIYLGPKNDAKHDDSELRTFLLENGYDLNRVEIMRSDIPYR